jgi:hypothetical protein
MSYFHNEAEDVREQVREEMAQVRTMCRLAGFPELADDLIAKNATRDEVLAALEDAEAKGGKRGGNAGTKTDPGYFRDAKTSADVYARFNGKS